MNCIYTRLKDSFSPHTPIAIVGISHGLLVTSSFFAAFAILSARLLRDPFIRLVDFFLLFNFILVLPQLLQRSTDAGFVCNYSIFISTEIMWIQ